VIGKLFFPVDNARHNKCEEDTCIVIFSIIMPNKKSRLDGDQPSHVTSAATSQVHQDLKNEDENRTLIITVANIDLTLREF